PLPWSYDEVDLSPEERRRLQELVQQPVAPGFIQVIQNFPSGFVRHPQAGVVIGRTMFETDRLPLSWVEACNRLDFIWVPSEFNRQTFAQAGVQSEKLVVIPGCLDATPFVHEEQQQAPLPRIARELSEEEHFVFLSVFDWTLHKGWDVLLRAFLEAFSDEQEVLLVLKVWSTMGYRAEHIQEQAATLIWRELDHDLLADRRVRFIHERLTRNDLQALYRATDAFVLPSRGEGWGRPYMEVMACGKPTIGTNWSGNTAFMNAENSYLIDYELQAVPESGWREIPTYYGHRWAEPDPEHLKQLLRRVFEERGEAAAIGQRAREHVLSHFNRQTVGRMIAQEMERLQEAFPTKKRAGSSRDENESSNRKESEEWTDTRFERTEANLARR
ncbi:MAG: glycosyltransferase family 4 protein, partial [Armatimonadota bacterium]|nr:glycosyltransferase family 4 protein [Armatimonadota bacterium]